MIRRHPHVFGETTVADADAQTKAWEDLKAAERAKAKPASEIPSALDSLPANLPALLQAEKFQRRAARVGFDWTETKDVVGKIREELEDVAHGFEGGAGQHRAPH